MAKRKRARTAEPTPSDLILETPNDTSLLDVLDKLLNKGVVLNGDIVLGVAGVDLVYLRLSTLLCAIDRIWPDEGRRKRRHNRGPRQLKSPGK
jgi:hypothetical protein